MSKSTFTIALKDIPVEIMPTMTSNDYATIWFGDKIVKEIFIFNHHIRLNTNMGQHRCAIDSSETITIS